MTIGSASSGAWVVTRVGSGSTTTGVATLLPLAGEGTGGSLGSGLGQALYRGRDTQSELHTGLPWGG